MINYIHNFAGDISLFDIPNHTKVRVGRRGDGGYVLLKELLGLPPTLYSYGVGDDVSFELDFLRLAGACSHVRLFDHTIAELPEKHPAFIHHKEPARVERSFPLNSVLKIDIEGGEWEFLKHAPISHCSQIVVEFHLHHNDPPQGCSPYFKGHFQRLMGKENRARFLAYSKILRRLNSTFFCFHAHINNSLPLWDVEGSKFPPLLELSFVRQDLVDEKYISHRAIGGTPALDWPNKSDRADYWWDPINCTGGTL